MVNSPSGNVQLMQKINRLKVLSFIRRNEPVSRPQIARETCLSLSSVTNIVNFLEERGLVFETGTEDASRVGRKAALLYFNADAYHYICVYIKSTGIHIARTNLAGKVFNMHNIGAPHNSLEKVLKKIIAAAEKMCSAEREKILAVGVAVNGSVEERSRLVVSVSHKWKYYDIGAVLERELGLPVIVENVSVTNAKYSIKFSDENVAFMDFDEGIGAVWHGGGAGNLHVSEIGHTIVFLNGDKCFCGNRGCLEVMCSPKRIVSIYKKTSQKPLPKDYDSAFDKIIGYAENGDETAVKVIGECIDYLCIGIKNLVMIFSPDHIKLNGGIYFKHDYIYDRVISGAHIHTLSGKKLEFHKTFMNDENRIAGVALYMSDCMLNISCKSCIV